MKQASIAILLLAFGAAALAQETAALRQSFSAPKVDVEQALKDLNAYQGGKLPFVEGFVGASDQPLGTFQRAYYQYTIEVQQNTDDQVTVSVNAKISAWHEDADASKSGYRELPSNGRLEADLLERLRTRLHTHAAEVAAARTPMVSPRLLGVPDTSSPEPAQSEPAAPSASLPSPSSTFRNLASKASSVPPATKPPEEDAHYKRLVREEKSLNDVIAAQQHPDGLVAVKAPHTPVKASPAEGARVVMYADAEDEFQFLKRENGWVHVQISGLNRGWIRSAQVEMLGGNPAASTASQNAGDQFKQTKSENSTFPGDWAPLKGKTVRIIWVQPTGPSTQRSRLNFAESVFKTQAPKVKEEGAVEGVVVVFDAAEGGMAAATIASLQKWETGNLSDAGFLKECWFDPADAFTASTDR